MKIQYQLDFDGLQVAPVSGDSDHIVVSALVFYEGDHTDSQGKSVNYSPERITEIAANSNHKLGEGVRVQLFKDHSYTSDSVIGWVKNFAAKEITADDLPHEGMGYLLGKQGVFADVAIAGTENIARYKDKLIKSVSAGIDLHQNYIYEVSVVPFPALAGASLFSQNLRSHLLKFAERIESIDLNPDNRQGLDPDGLKAQATEDLSASLLKFFGVNERNSQVEDRGLMTEKESPQHEVTMDASPDVSQYAAEIAQLKKQLEERDAALYKAEHEKAITLKLTELRRKGGELRDAGKLTPAAYNAMFEGEGEAIAKYSAPDSNLLECVEYHLNMIDLYGGNVVQFGRVIEDPALESVDDSDAEAIAQRLSKNVLKYGGRR